MSAFIVSDAHIDALVILAQTYMDGDAATRETELGRMLRAENIRSVASCSRTAPEAVTYRYTPPARVPTAVEGLKLLDGYDYQAGACDDYTATPAYRFYKTLRAALKRHLPRDEWECQRLYEQAPWTLPDRASASV